MNTTKSYLTFLLSNKEFAVDVEKINNIIELTKLANVPNAPSFMRGSITHEGKALPVVDLRQKMGMTPTTYTMHTCILITQIENMGRQTKLGLLVDAVQSVLEIEPGEIHPIVDRRVASFRPYLKGKTNYEGHVIKIVEVDSVFAKWELEAMDALDKNAHAKLHMSMIN